MRLIAIAVGGACGTLLRYWIGVAMAAPTGAIPVGTLVVNVVGSFILGVIIAAMPGPSTMRWALATGFCGGFTTFSTFSSEVIDLAQRGAVARAAGYAGISLALGLFAVLAGAFVGRAVVTMR
jgi:CrcB protein